VHAWNYMWGEGEGLHGDLFKSVSIGYVLFSLA
jgi:hypothetical protein